MDYAKTTFIGRVANVTIRPKRASFKIAVSYRVEGPTHWFDVVAFDEKQIVVIRDHVPAGRLIEEEALPYLFTALAGRVGRGRAGAVSYEGGR